MTSKEVGGNIIEPRAGRPAVDQPQLHRLRRPAAGHRAQHQHRVVRLRLDQRQRPGLRATTTTCSTAANNNDDVIGQRAGTQARTPLESIQEFQVLTNQFDAEFGRTTGAVINAVTKRAPTSSAAAPSASSRTPSLTAEELFRQEEQPGRSPRPAVPAVRRHARRAGGQGQGPLLRQPRARDRTTATTPSTSRRGPSSTPPGHDETRVWNTLVRFDHQINANHTWDVRWLREYSPQYNQIIARTAAVTLAAAREEDDLDQTVVGTLNSVLGNTKVNTLRVAFTQEDVSFANAGFNGNGGTQDQLLSRRSRTRPSPTSRARWRRRASTTAISSRTPSRGSSPARRAITTCSVASSTSTSRTIRATRTTGTAPSPSRATQPFDAARLRGPIPSGCRSACRANRCSRTAEGALLRRLRPGQVADQPTA